tara:strand:- start:2830 stop:3570 length:741 start_codon:yes stop_codon:yes gene_type:complete
MIKPKNILLGVIVVVILYLVYSQVFRDNTTKNLNSGGNAKNAVMIPSTKLPGNSNSVDFSFSIWIYINSWEYRYGETKTIYKRLTMDTTGDSGSATGVSPELALASTTNDLSITMGVFDPVGDKTSPTSLDSWVVHNIPIQKWCNIIISTNNKAVDTYIDGKLVNTHVLDGVPKMDPASNIYLTPDGGFSGEHSKFRYMARSVNPREAYEIYRDGPGGNWLSDLLGQYKLKLAFMKNNEEINSFSI